MDYKVLYRKYRPQTFEDVVGQDHIVKLLKSSIVGGKISHSYLFCGPRGTGKTSVAKIFAKAINCNNNSEGTPCLKCEFCKMDVNPDILEIDAASNNSVDEIRELRNNTRLAASCSKYKVYIIDEVHMLSIGAFNALLKTLEEPPQNIVFILATTEIQKVPITILSRCQRMDFKKISEADIIGQLKSICKKEKISISNDALVEISRLADGGMRDALSVLDQISSKSEKIEVSDIINVTASISINDIKSINDKILTGDISIIEDLSVIEEKGIDFAIFANKYVDYLKNDIVIAIKNDLITKDIVREKHLMSILTNIIMSNRKLINGYSLFEVKILEFIDVSEVKEENNQPLVDKNTVKLINEDSNEKTEIFEEPTDDSNDLFMIIKARINNCFCEACKEQKSLSISRWESFLDDLRDNDLTTFSLVDGLVVEASSTTHILLSCKTESHALLANQKSDLIEKKLNSMYKSLYKIVVVTAIEWANLKKEYISNKDKKYSLIDESVYNKVDNVKKSIAYEIFDNSKIVIK